MADANDDAFFDALAGRPHAAMSAAERSQVEALRASVHDVEREFELSEEHHQQQVERLLFRLRREDQLNPSRRKWALPLAAAATVTAIAVVLVVSKVGLPGPDDGQPEMRGAAGKIPVIESADVDATAQAVVAALARAGVSAQAYPLGVNRGVNASVSSDQRANVVQQLEPLGVDLPASGELRLEVRERPRSK